MTRRLVPLFLCIGLAAVATPVPAQAQGAPTLHVQFESIDALMADVAYLGDLAGQGDIVEQFGGVVKAVLDGVDTKRPLGAYGNVGENGVDSTAVVLVPISDQKAFVKFMDNLNLLPKKLEGGLWQFTPPNSPVDAFLRFANDYAYITANLDNDLAKKSIALKNLRKPADVLPTDNQATASINIRIAGIPDGIKQLVLQQLELAFEQAKDEEFLNDSPSQVKLKSAILDEIGRHISMIIKDGGELSLKVDVDKDSGEISEEISLTAKPGSDLAKELAKYSGNSIFSKGLGGNSAVNALVHFMIPEKIHEAMGSVIDEGLAEGLKEVQNPERREVAKQFADVFGTTMKARKIDLAFSLRGPSDGGKYGILMGMKVPNGTELEKALRAMVKRLKPEEQERIDFDNDKAGGANIHRLNIQKEFADSDAAKYFGNEPLYLAVSKNAVLVGFGEGGLSAVKDALTADPAKAPFMGLNVVLGRIGPMLALDNQESAGIAKEIFGGGKGNDKLRFSIEGGKQLRARFVMKGDVLKFLIKVGQMQEVLPEIN